jgi:hypothetical protein
MRCVALSFHITCVSVLGLMHLRSSFWLEILISCVLSVEVFTMFIQDWIVAKLWYHFLPLEKEGVWPSSQTFSHHAEDTGSGPLIHSRRLAPEAITSDRHTHYENTEICN